MDYEKKVESILKRKLREKHWKYKLITELKNKHKGQDIYVLGAGASMNYIDPKFFDNKITVGVNMMYQIFPCTYIVKIHNEESQKVIDAEVTLIISKLDGGLRDILNQFNGNYYVFKHMKNMGGSLSITPLEATDSLKVGASTIHSAIHFAYFLGAANIILCGCDCGMLDNVPYVNGYYNETSIKRLSFKVEEDYEFFLLTERQTLNLANLIRDKGVSVYSLNPFINLGLENHAFTRRLTGGSNGG